MNRCAHNATCKREGKVKHSCLVEGCAFSLHACLFHKDKVHLKVQDHVKTAHPDVYAHILQASGLS